MQDSYGRTIDYIRISVTDQCNLRCIYCMPEGCIQKVPKQMLNDDQILMLCRCFAQLGVSRVKITGGEPLLRPQVPVLIKEIRQIPGIRSVTLTTNGILLKKYLPQLVKAGLTGVNISIDSLNSVHYQQISGRDRLLPVMDSLKSSLILSGTCNKAELCACLWEKSSGSGRSGFTCQRSGPACTFY